jgi:hypothetical protein
MGQDGDGDGDSVKRIFIGGVLPGAITEAELHARLTQAFKCTVDPVRFVAKKNDLRTARLMAFTNLSDCPRSQFKKRAALLNGSKWRGCTIRVEESKPWFLAKLHQEVADKVDHYDDNDDDDDDAEHALSYRWNKRRAKRLIHSLVKHDEKVDEPVKAKTAGPVSLIVSCNRIKLT